MDIFDIQAPVTQTAALVNCFNDAVLLFKKDVLKNSIVFIETNNTALQLFNYNRKEFLNLSLQDVFSKITYKHILGAKDISKASEGYCVTKEGKEFPVEFYSNRINNDDENYILVIKDITRKRENEQQLSRYIEELHETKDSMEHNAYDLVLLNLKLEESEEQLKELNASKDKFFSIIAHDLKSPFTSFIGLTELLAEDSCNMEREDVSTYLSELNKNAQNLYGLLENLLSWSRVQTGRMDFTPQFISPADLLKQTLNLFKPGALQKNISLSSSISTNKRIYADLNMIETVLRNLVSNAIKFTPTEGNIHIDFSDDEDEMLKVSVKDSGVGIDEDDISKLFRIDSTHTTLGTQNERGTGLGLILCKDLVERNSGKISVESTKGVGTMFTFTTLTFIPAKKD